MTTKPVLQKIYKGMLYTEDFKKKTFSTTRAQR